jgi:hypothetical protein
MKILSVVAKLFHEDGRTGRLTAMTKLIVAFTILRTHLSNIHEFVHYEMTIYNSTCKINPQNFHVSKEVILINVL